MTIAVGQTVPDVKLTLAGESGPSPVQSGEYFKGKKVVLFSVPGAFTPTCSAKHLPGYVENAAAIKAKGVDEIVCTAVNDGFVMGAWGRASGSPEITMLGDGTGDFAKAIMSVGVQLAIKALISGALIAIASEVARRSPGWGGLIASLPLTSMIALVWLWRDTHDPLRVADFVSGTALYVIAALPAFGLIALLLRRGAGIAPAMLFGALAAMAGYLALMWAGRRFGLPV